MNWKSYVEKKNAKTYVLPDGWDSRDEVATQLDCSPEKVDDHLRPALKSGEVIKQQFKVWDESQKRLTFVVAYREAAKDRVAPVVPLDTAKALELKRAGKSYAEIGVALGGLSGESVRSKLRRAV
jgi:DNA-binding CsgD family transcriptional regulator